MTNVTDNKRTPQNFLGEKTPNFLFLEELKNILLIALSKRFLYSFKTVQYIENGEIQLCPCFRKASRCWFF